MCVKLTLMKFVDVNNTGWAYIYELMNFTSGPMWSLTSELQSPIGENVYFGHSVRLSATNAMVGAIGFRKSFPFNCKIDSDRVV